jgi:hypothetical protein
MLIGPTAGRAIWHTPKCEQAKLDRDPSYRATRFHVRVPSDIDQVDIANASATMRDGQLALTPASSALMACRRCVIGWENLAEMDEAGKPRSVQFVGDKIDGEVRGALPGDTSRIPPRIRMEILDKVRSLMEVTEEDLD